MVSSGQLALVAGSAVKPVAKVFLVCLSGAFLRRKGVLTQEIAKGISGIIKDLLVPAFLFIRLVKAVSLEALTEWWPIPLFVAINIFLGFCLGMALVTALGKGRCGDLRGVLIASCTVGNMGMLPLSLSDAACQPGLEKFSSREGGYAACSEEAQAMVAFGLWIAGLAAFTVGDWLVRPRDGEDLLKAYAQMEDGQEAKPEQQQGSPSSFPKVQENSWQAEGKALLLNFCNPPTITTALGLICGSIPTLKWLLTSLESPVSPLGGAVELVASALVPCQLLVLGSNFGERRVAGDSGAGGFGGTSLPAVAMAGVCAVRLVVLPAIGVLLMHGMHRIGAMPEDPLVEFIALLQFSTPTGMTLTTLCFLYGKGHREISSLHFVQYMFAIPAVSVAMMVYLAVEL